MVKLHKTKKFSNDGVVSQNLDFEKMDTAFYTGNLQNDKKNR